MYNEQLEALIEDKMAIVRARAQLDIREDILDTKLEAHFSPGIQAQQRDTAFGSILRIEHEEIVLATEAIPEMIESLRAQFDTYFKVQRVVVHPTAECLRLTADKRHPLYDLLNDQLIVKRVVKYAALPAGLPRPSTLVAAPRDGGRL